MEVLGIGVQVGSARIDENGKISGGKAGDQTGKEVCTQAWYLHSKGWRNLRANSAAAAERIALNMERACANGNIGYDQHQRLTLYDLAKAVGWDCAKVAVACETDCSALARVCVLYAGISDPGNFTTSNLAAKLLATGAFCEMAGSKYTANEDYLRRGDILVTKTKGHVVVALGSGRYAEAAAAEPVYGADELQKGDACAAVKILQQVLIELSYDCGRYGADGEFGSDTLSAVKAFQLDAGLTADGIVGAKTYAALGAALDALAARIDADDPAEQSAPDGNLTVAAGTWNLRTGPGTEYPKASAVQGGDKLQSADMTGWMPIAEGGRALWISQKGLAGQ